jgi:biotin carboxyl carrier protein
MKSFKYTINGNVYKVHINSVIEDVADVEVNGTPFHVKMEKPSKKQIIPLAQQAKQQTKPAQQAPSVPKPAISRPAATASSGAVKSPLPGIIIDVKCSVGDTVKKGQTLVILEAMKMENAINAPGDGRVTEIKVQKGDTVLENADLIVIG